MNLGTRPLSPLLRRSRQRAGGHRAGAGGGRGRAGAAGAQVPRARIAVLVGTALSPGQTHERVRRGGRSSERPSRAWVQLRNARDTLVRRVVRCHLEALVQLL